MTDKDQETWEILNNPDKSKGLSEHQLEKIARNIRDALQQATQGVSMEQAIAFVEAALQAGQCPPVVLQILEEAEKRGEQKPVDDLMLSNMDAVLRTAKFDLGWNSMSRWGVFLGKVLARHEQEKSYEACESVLAHARSVDLMTASDDSLRHVSILCLTEGTSVQHAAESIISQWLSPLQIPAKDFLRAWKASDQSDPAYSILINLRGLRKFEEKKPGVARVLHADFGILCFGRYVGYGMFDALFQQYEERDHHGPYVLLAIGVGDSNGALGTHVDEIWKKAKDLRAFDTTIRIVEVWGKADTVQRFRQLHERYAVNTDTPHKPRLLIAAGHGWPEGVQIGPRKSQAITVKDVQSHRKTMEYLREFLGEDPTVILASCLTGGNGGIGAELSKGVPGSTVWAPPNEISPGSGVYFDIEGKPPERPTFGMGKYCDDHFKKFIVGEPEGGENR